MASSLGRPLLSWGLSTQMPMCRSEPPQNKCFPKGIFWETTFAFYLQLVIKVWFSKVCLRPRFCCWDDVCECSLVSTLCISTSAKNSTWMVTCGGEWKAGTWWTHEIRGFRFLVGWASLAEIGFSGANTSFSRVPKDDFCKYLLMFAWHLQSLVSIRSHPGMLTGNKHKSGHELSWCGCSF